MIYPKFLNKNDVIGITACSAGILSKLDEYLGGVDNFNKQGFVIKETKNVRTDGIVSSSKEERVKELNELLVDKNVKLIQIAAGGDLLYEMIALVDFDLIKKNPKWIAGSSDPTSLLFIITTMLDIATIYTPCNVSGFNQKEMDVSLLNYFKIITGKRIKQVKREKYELVSDDGADGYNLDTMNIWIINKNVNIEGRIIGGCLECLKDVIGTKYDYVNKFISKYENDGIVWYFDIFSMTSEGVYNTLLQFKNAGWFRKTKCVLIGKVKYPNTFTDLTYEEIIHEALGDIPYIYKFDIGHVKPSFTIVNGSKVKITNESLEMEY